MVRSSGEKQVTNNAKQGHVTLTRARYHGAEACFTFDGELMEGDFPSKQRKLVAAWSVLNMDELEANWELARNKQELFRIRPP